MELKTCSKCQEEKSLDNFSRNKNKKTGFNYICKDCQNNYTREHYKLYKQKYIDKALRRNQIIKQELVGYVKAYKEGKECIRCGENDAACLDFHHINPDNKLAEICDLTNSGCKLEILQAEIDKCVLLCSNCHRKLHAGRFVLAGRECDGNTSVLETEKIGSIPIRLTECDGR